ncbi:hypothetical protein KKD37_01540 [Patescibacteria group bacterium]|nr:hypothetical protein [Patescibacteria group bacterium]
MKNLVITGTSGVGKTFLEEQLEKQKLTFQIPKYTDRPARPGENSTKLVCLSSEEFQTNRTNFFFTLKYGEYNYGWKKEDLKKEPVSLAITQGSLEEFLELNSNFLPILLEVNENNLEMLRQRMIKRGESEDKVFKRLELSKKELKNARKYQKILKKYNGLIFQIKNDHTIFEEVIPTLAMLK